MVKINVKRISMMVIYNIFRAPYWFAKICIYGKSDKYTEQQRFDLLKHVVKGANKGGRVKIDVYGLENLPEQSGYVMFPNHQGYFDVLALLEAHPVPFTVVMKKEVKNVPFLKQVLIALRAQAIDREDVRQALNVINQMTKEVKEGRNYLIFAEGTRSKNNTLLDFKGGSFKSAINAKCPIVPVALIDAYKVFDTRSIKKQTVMVKYLKPLYYEDYKGLKSTEIAKIVRDRINNAVSEVIL